MSESEEQKPYRWVTCADKDGKEVPQRIKNDGSGELYFSDKDDLSDKETGAQKLKPYLIVEYKKDGKWTTRRVRRDNPEEEYFSDDEDIEEDEAEKQAEQERETKKKAEEQVAKARAKRKKDEDKEKEQQQPKKQCVEKEETRTESSDLADEKKSEAKSAEGVNEARDEQKPREEEALHTEETEAATAANDNTNNNAEDEREVLDRPKEIIDISEHTISEQNESEKSVLPVWFDYVELRRVLQQIQEEKDPYRGETASADDPDVADLANIEATCCHIEDMNAKEGVHTRCAVSKEKPFRGVLVQEQSKGILSICGECGDPRLCFVFLKIQTTVIHGEEGKKEKTEKVESLVDGPVCSNRCIIRKTIAAFFDHVRLLRVLEQRSVGVLACAIGRKITLINANNVSLQLELSAEEEKNKEKDKEDLKTNLQSETVSETLAAAEAMTTDMFNTFETFLSRIEIVDEVRKERTEEQAKIIEELQKRY